MCLIIHQAKYNHENELREGVTLKSPNTQGYYLKELRKKFHLQQNQILEDFTRVSKIENDKERLSEDMAITLANNMNNLLKYKTDETINYLYFYDHEKYMIIIEAEDYIKLLEHASKENDYNEFNRLLEKFNNGFSRYDIPEIKFKIFKTAADYFKKQKEYYKCYLYYSRCVDNAIAYNNNDDHIVSKIAVYYTLILLGNSNEAIELLNEMLDNKDLTHSHKYQIHHRIGYAYLRNKHFDAALNEFEKAELYVDKNELSDITDLYLQRALCYRYLDQPLIAIKLLINGLNILKQGLPLTRLSFIKNIISAYKYINDKENMKAYMTKFVSLINSIDEKDDSFIIAIYLDLFDDFIFLDDYTSSSFCIQRAFYISRHQNNYYYQNEALKKMFLLSHKMEDEENINNLVNHVKSLLTEYPSKLDNKNVVFLLIEYLVDTNQKDALKEILQLINKEV